MRYFRSKELEDAENAAFRLYMATCGEVVARYMGIKSMPHFADIIKVKPVDNRTGDEIALDVIKRAGLVKK